MPAVHKLESKKRGVLVMVLFLNKLMSPTLALPIPTSRADLGEEPSIYSETDKIPVGKMFERVNLVKRADCLGA